MLLIGLGVMAFFLFIVYDINSIVLKNKVLKMLFLIGVLLLAFSTLGLIILVFHIDVLYHFNFYLFSLLSVLMLALLAYSLFFALPFKDTYIKESTNVCQYGIYALCRHPGVLFLAAFYFFLGLALDSKMLLTAGLIFSLCNLAYVIFQDRWTFVRLFDDYQTYQRTTPFLIPNLQSIRLCFKTWHQEME